jgi:hypothetical protein
VIGGESPAAFRRARAAGAWYGWEHTPEQIAGVRASLGADVEITLTPGPPGPLNPELAREFAQAGVSRLVLQPPDTSVASMETLIAATGETLIGQVP